MGLVLLLAAACGTQEPAKCTTANCSGCCDEAGACIGTASQSESVCGIKGAACRVCLPDQLCKVGACMHDPNANVGGGGGALGGGGGSSSGGGEATGGGSAPCGSLGEACCSSGALCNLNFICDRDGVCTTAPGVDAGPPHCGFVNEPCCSSGALCTASGTTCLSGTCISSAPDAGPAGAAGAACSVDTDCADGLCLRGTDFPNGYCSKSCTTTSNCTFPSRCGVNDTGVGPANVCYAKCTQPRQSPGDCRAGYVCLPDESGLSVCIPGCSATSCAGGQQCDSRGFCCGTLGAVCCGGTTCNAGTACQSGTCIQAATGGGGGSTPTGGGAGGGGVTPIGGGSGGGGVPAGGGGGGAVGGGGGGTPAGGGSGGGGVPAGGGGGSPAGGGGGATTVGSVGSQCVAGQTQTWCSALGIYASCISSWPGGYCSMECSSGRTCPSGSSCSPYVIDGASECLLNCASPGTSNGCRAGYVCDKFLIPGNSTQGSCIDACDASTNCGTNRRCDSGFCCGTVGYKCCGSGTACVSGTCGADGYCH